MTAPWKADVSLDSAGAAHLIDSQFSDLAPARLEWLGEGWDNAAYLVNGAWVFRFPRRKMGADLLARENRILPLLAPLLPLPAPRPVYFGAPADGYPYPFAGYRMLPGQTACGFGWTHALRAAAAEPLGRFLCALHNVPVDQAARAWARRDPSVLADAAARNAVLHERWPRAAEVLPGLDVVPLRDLADRLAGAEPHDAPGCWVHGDLYARHLLVDGVGALCGVIDWGDVHVGDPACDLMIAFTFLPPEARGAFFASYGPVSAAALARARFRAIFHGAALVVYGHEVGDAPILRAGAYALEVAGKGDGF